jgi:hypothetical protein
MRILLTLFCFALVRSGSGDDFFGPGGDDGGDDGA